MHPTDRTRVRLILYCYYLLTSQTASVGSSRCYGRREQQAQSRGRRGWPVQAAQP